MKRDPYSDWQQVYRTEVIDRARHWPVSNKKDNEVEGSIITGSNNE
jgi:hypothetical protein